MKIIAYLRSVLLLAMGMILTMSCSKDNGSPTFPEEKTYDMTGFARGADVSWLTEMENSGIKFYDANGKATECMTLLRTLGVNAIRLRVWVNPSDGWCNKDDVVAKAKRAASLGMRIMIDFHYSDTWADPGKQNKPAAWASMSVDELKTAVAAHTTDVLTALKNVGVTPEWVQVGNETTDGMLWEEGRASKSMANYAALNNAGYDAAKAIFPNTKVIVHLDNGWKSSLYTWMFNELKSNGGKWDVIGMSLYPDKDNWQSRTTSCISNIKSLISAYKCEVMICEVGMAVSDASTCKEWLTSLMTQAKAISGCEGVFYWEPECYGTWKSYGKGAFDASGKPTVAMDAFAADTSN